ncbi:MAG: hypothetical protein MO852_13945 [Candidatus Devosia euplotis]|nr:hypothetical protein [Candidatus Devosia euplotis]
MVANAAEKLASMLSGIRENTAALESISREIRLQTSSIDEVNVAVRTMDEMTQNNAALAEEVNAAIEQTEAQATEMDRIVDILYSMLQSARLSAEHQQRRRRATKSRTCRPGPNRLPIPMPVMAMLQ